MNGFNLQPDFTNIPNVKISYNIGMLMDIPTGKYVKGKHGESILNGGLAAITGVVGIGNNFKSTIMHDMMLIAMSRMPQSTANTYDTEMNIQESRLKQIAYHVEGFNKEDIIEQGRWKITDKSLYYANEWYEIWKKFIKTKVDSGTKLLATTPFLDRDKVSLLKVIYPTFTQVDSFSEFETQDVGNIKNNNELGDSGLNTIHMRQGLAKTAFLSDVPKLVTSGNNPMLLTAHIGKDIPMDARAPPVKKLQFLKNGDKIKGATDKFMFLTTNCIQCQNAIPYQNDVTKGPEYPRNSDDDMKGDTDLNLVTLILLRNKNGPSGLVMQILVSQREGVLPSLSEFHYIKTNDRFGIAGNVQNYTLDLLPDVKLSRTAVRGKINSDPLLRRALNITSEMCQMTYLWDDLKEGLMCTPKELYDDIKALGYNWDQLLKTRGWWTFDNDKQELPFLSTMDLLLTRKKLYVPYFLKDNEVPESCKDVPRIKPAK